MSATEPNYYIRLMKTSELHIKGGMSSLFRYHNNCHKRFINPREVKSAQVKKGHSKENQAIQYVIRSIRNKPDEIWVSTDLHEIYRKQGGPEANGARFISSLSEMLQGRIYIFKAAGMADILMQKDKASSLFRNVSASDDVNEIHLKKVATTISVETKFRAFDQTTYQTITPENLFDQTTYQPITPENLFDQTTYQPITPENLFDQTTYQPITPENLFDNCSETLMVLLSLITPNLDKTLSAAMIGHILHGAVTGSTSMLQLSIGHLLREKKLMERLFKYGISGSYLEVRRFKISAAVSEGNKDQKLNASDGLIQYSRDNFDANISSQNGLQQTHGLLLHNL